MKHSSAPSASATCWRSDSQRVGVDAVFHRGGIGRRGRFSLGQRSTDLFHDRVPDYVGFRAELRLETLDWIATGERLSKLRGHVRGVGVRGVSMAAKRDALHRLR